MWVILESFLPDSTLDRPDKTIEQAVYYPLHNIDPCPKLLPLPILKDGGFRAFAERKTDTTSNHVTVLKNIFVHCTMYVYERLNHYESHDNSKESTSRLKSYEFLFRVLLTKMMGDLKKAFLAWKRKMCCRIVHFCQGCHYITLLILITKPQIWREENSASAGKKSTACNAVQTNR